MVEKTKIYNEIAINLHYIYFVLIARNILFTCTSYPFLIRQSQARPSYLHYIEHAEKWRDYGCVDPYIKTWARFVIPPSLPVPTLTTPMVATHKKLNHVKTMPCAMPPSKHYPHTPTKILYRRKKKYETICQTSLHQINMDVATQLGGGAGCILPPSTNQDS